MTDDPETSVVPRAELNHRHTVAPSLADGTKMSYLIGGVTGAEFLRKVTRPGRVRRVAVRFDRRHGNGNYGTLHYGSQKTVKDLRQEIGAGLLAAMLAQLGQSRRISTSRSNEEGRGRWSGRRAASRRRWKGMTTGVMWCTLPIFPRP